MESENVKTLEEEEGEEEQQQQQELAMECEMIRLENSVLSRHLARLVTWKQSDVHFKLGVLEGDAGALEDTSDSLKSSSSKNLKLGQVMINAPGRQSLRFRSISMESQDTPSSTKELSKVSAASVAPPPLSLEEKSEIVEDESAALHEQMEKLRSENERVLDDLRAVMDEADECAAEVRKEKSDLRREVLLDADSNSVKYPCAETMLRFLEGKFKSKRMLIEKLQQKNDMLQKQILEAEKQFASKKDLRDVLHAVDFEQIKIQNQQFRMKIQDRDAELQSLKADSKKVAQAIDVVGSQLNNSIEDASQLKQCFNEHSPQLMNVKEQIIAVNKQKKKLQEMLLLLMHEGDGPPLPHVLDYTRVNEKLGFLKKAVNTWKNKVEIAELTARQIEKHAKVVRKKLLPAAFSYTFHDQTQVNTS